MPSSEIFVIVGGVKYTGWESISVRRSIESMCGSFEVTLADRQDGTDWKLATQKDVKISIGDDLVLTGVIDVVSPSFTKDKHQISIKGRDKTCDLVDCSVEVPPSEFHSLDLTTVIQRLCKPFSIDVSADVDVGAKIPIFAIQKGETVFEAIDRACRLRGVLPITDTRGRLTLSTSGFNKSEEPLIFGKNVKTASAVYDYTNRFSKYVVEAQSGAASLANAVWTGSYTGKTTDPAIKRHRPFIMQAETQADGKSCQTRAVLEAAVRAAKSQIVNVSVQGWRQRTNSGKLWVHNEVVNVDIPAIYVKSNLLITEITYTMNNESGSECEMRLMREDAFNAGTKFKTKHVSFQSNQDHVAKAKNLGFDFGDFSEEGGE